jgi:hypothetical protein
MLQLLEDHAAVEGVARVRKAVPIVMDALRNPDLYGEVLAEAYARAVANNSDIVAELKAMARESGMTVVETPPVIVDPATFYPDFAAQNIAIVDKAFTLGEHGEMMHLIQDLVVDRALNTAVFRIPNMPATSGTFRLWLQDLETVVKFPDVLTGGRPMIDIKLGETVWRSTYDLLDKAHLPTPEATMPKLREALRHVLGATDLDLP